MQHLGFWYVLSLKSSFSTYSLGLKTLPWNLIWHWNIAMLLRPGLPAHPGGWRSAKVERCVMSWRRTPTDLTEKRRVNAALGTMGTGFSGGFFSSSLPWKFMVRHHRSGGPSPKPWSRKPTSCTAKNAFVLFEAEVVWMGLDCYCTILYNSWIDFDQLGYLQIKLIPARGCSGGHL